MSKILVLGAALGGLQTALLLAGDGHRVTVLERDAHRAPADAESAWSRWRRPGIPQMQQTHLPLARWLQLAEAHLPELVGRMTAAGAVRMNVVAPEPGLRGSLRAGDERFDTLAARRSLLEAAATEAAEAAGIDIRRGVACRGLHRSSRGLHSSRDAGASGRARSGRQCPVHVTGVETNEGTLTADLVVDCTGRRSQLPSWLRDIGVREVGEERGRRGFVYYSRYFRSADGALPTSTFPLVVEHGSLGLLRIPADHGSYSVCLVSRGDDLQLRHLLRREAAWSAAVRQFPGAELWLDGHPLTDGVRIMAGLSDRKRNLYDTEHPLVTGLVAVGDSWAFTVPTVGRGLTMSLQHGLVLRDALRRTGTGEPEDLVAEFGRATDDSLAPVYRRTTFYTHHRLAEMDAHAAGLPYRDPDWSRSRALVRLAQRDPDALRAERAAAHLLPGAREELRAPALADAVARLVPEVEQDLPPGPSRAELLAAIGG
ncbi:FAD-dependent oxidoreductase [Streptomyces sp. VMFN-G11Ma]|uniref:FAD-dependent oxidoreductase n=1 Tax=Streptomyces sp. VMFN-G11Ma TaxID=2135609 RepID=UPI000D3469DB|nr:FAD-dependent oxidoreductase [Streptomyces sp. VMFN-G11Ma]PTM86979.1 2-polyprenyl-6-methoxyphenol hydroxylase-like FAD-dependent oxidoreductase [Streptomyces sp. VMFN-G11Ma]